MSPADVALTPVAAGARWRDLAAIHEAAATQAYSHIFADPFPVAEAEERWSSYAESVLLAARDGTSVGFAAWSGQVLDALYVLPAHAGCGIGTRLLNALPGTVRQLWVLVDNHAGRTFYERRGWLDTGVMRPAYPPVEEVLYQR